MDEEPIGQDEEDQFAAFLEYGMDFAGSLVAVGVGGVVGGPVGAILGAAAPIATRVLGRSALDHMRRQLSEREQMRTAALVQLARARIDRNLALGYELRSDGFFTGIGGHRSIAAEIAEGVLISAQREHEEKKLPYLANLTANLAFSEEIGRGDANLLLRIANGLSYRQLCLLTLFGRKDAFPPMRDGTFDADFAANPRREDLIELTGLLTEADNLMTADLIQQPERFMGALVGRGLTPASVDLLAWGGILYELMGLADMPREELEPLATLLR